MKLRLIVTAMLLGLAVPAIADYATLQAGAYEVRLSEIRLPRGPAGTIAFKPCSTCEVYTKRVDASTHWMIDGKVVKPREFREVTDQVGNRDKKAVTVIYDLERDRVTSVSIYL